MLLREKIISLIYREILGRDVDDIGLGIYMRSSVPIEVVYSEVYNSDEAMEYRDRMEEERFLKQANIKLPLTLAMFVKDVEDSVEMAIRSVLPIVSEVVITDTGSSDRTIEVCKDLGARVYSVGFSDFGSIRTVSGHLSRQPWVLGLDADEVVLSEDLPKFKDLIENSNVDAWGLPRKRWADLEMLVQVEPEAYPDFQYRLFRNDLNIIYVRRIHEIIKGTDKKVEALDGPCIQHFQDVFKFGEKLKSRNLLYKNLYDKDICDGVGHEGLAVQPIDEV